MKLAPRLAVSAAFFVAIGAGAQQYAHTPAIAATTHSRDSHRSAMTSAAVNASYAKGQALLREGQYRQAAQEFSAAIKQHDHLAQSYAGLGLAYWYQQQYKNSFRAYRQAVSLDPRNSEYVYKAGLSALYSGNTNAAITYSSVFISMRPTLFTGYHLRFLAYNKALNRKKLLPDARMEVKLAPHRPDAYGDLGIALAQNTKYSQAIGEFSRAIALQPGNFRWFIDRAVAENLNKQPQAAMRDLLIARRLAPDAQTRRTIGLAIQQLTKAMHRHK